ncbi:hypothetical protein PSN01_00160 [Micromonospora saelicesensis]|nr:hypothetical protein PSN01_00160 [Micromonospora saelicesensis]
MLAAGAGEGGVVGSAAGAAGLGADGSGGENARSRLATPAARSPAPVASRSANSGLGSRNAAMPRQTGQTQHSAEPVAKAPPVPGRASGPAL